MAGWLEGVSVGGWAIDDLQARLGRADGDGDGRRPSLTGSTGGKDTVAYIP